MKRATRFNSVLLLGGLTLITAFQNCAEPITPKTKSATTTASSYGYGSSYPPTSTPYVPPATSSSSSTSNSSTTSSSTTSSNTETTISSTTSVVETPLVLHITNLYRVTMGREPDSAGLSYWQGQYTSGSVNCRALNEAFVSQTFAANPSTFASVRDAAIRNDGDIFHELHLKNLYRALYRRDADEEGFAFWYVRLKDRRITVAELEGNFYEASEFQRICSQLQ